MVDNGCVPHLLSMKHAQYQQKFIDLVVLMLMEGAIIVIHACHIVRNVSHFTNHVQ